MIAPRFILHLATAVLCVALFAGPARGDMPRGTGTNSFLVRDKSGLRYTFGDTTSSRAGSSVSAACSTHVWMLTRVADQWGNQMEISYLKSGNLPRPSSIKYGKHSGGVPGHTFEVAFAWLSRPAADQWTPAASR